MDIIDDRPTAMGEQEDNQISDILGSNHALRIQVWPHLSDHLGVHSAGINRMDSNPILFPFHRQDFG